MVLGKKCGSRASEGYGLGLVRSSSFARKRVFLSKAKECGAGAGGAGGCVTPSKRQRFDQDLFFPEENPSLENLPQEILARILCGVEHDDLKNLFFVSTAVREATLIAKQMHFAYSTPKKTVGFLDAGLFGNFDDVEAPNAPKQSRVPRNRLCPKKLADISVALFASDNDDEGECWPKRDLFG